MTPIRKKFDPLIERQRQIEAVAIKKKRAGKILSPREQRALDEREKRRSL
jgi:hypothetical protein